MKRVLSTFAAAALLAASPAFAAGDASNATAGSTALTQASPAMTEGEVRKVDTENKKITLKHGEIKNLDMPGMTMVFQVKEPGMLDKVKVGDKVRFTAEKVNGAITLTTIEAAK